jgi:hypothetical protein
MDEEMTVIGVLINWFPIMLIVAVWVLYMRLCLRRSRSSSGRNCPDLMEDFIQETKTQNASLVKIIEKLDARIARLEDRPD